MSTLILFLPPARPGPASEYAYTLTADGHSALQHATAPAALLPEPTRPGGEVVAVVPARALSWQRVTMPAGVPLGAGQQTPRRQALLSYQRQGEARAEDRDEQRQQRAQVPETLASTARTKPQKPATTRAATKPGRSKQPQPQTAPPRWKPESET